MPSPTPLLIGVNQQINRFWTHTHILANGKWKALSSASTCNQQINAVLESYWFKISLFTNGKIWKIVNQQINRIWSHIHIFASGGQYWWSTNQHRFGELLVQNLTSTIWKMTKIVNQRINRFWTHTHIWKMASLR